MHGWKNTNGFSEDPRVAGGSPLPAPAAPSICRLERPVFGPILARFLEAGWPENPKTGGKGTGRTCSSSYRRYSPVLGIRGGAASVAWIGTKGVPISC